MLGIAYQKAIGVDINLNLSKLNYIRAAESGYSKSDENLAIYLYQGDLPSSDKYQESRKHSHACSKTGSSHCMAIYGRLLAEGLGGSKDISEGTFWLNKAMKEGSPAGPYFLAQLTKDNVLPYSISTIYKYYFKTVEMINYPYSHNVQGGWDWTTEKNDAIEKMTNIEKSSLKNLDLWKLKSEASNGNFN